MERKGASYKITQKRGGGDPNNLTNKSRRPSGSNVPTRDTGAHINKNGVIDQEYADWRSQQKQREYGGY